MYTMNRTLAPKEDERKYSANKVAIERFAVLSSAVSKRVTKLNRLKRQQNFAAHNARFLFLNTVSIKPEMKKLHEDVLNMVRNDSSCWTSHTIMIINTTRSMQTNNDMWGTRSRLKSVWFSVALDFIAERLENCNATVTDVVSIITMGNSPIVWCKEVPTTWILYNRIANMYTDEKKSIREGFGYFFPSLTIAGELMRKIKSNTSCVAALMVISDGAPPDEGPIYNGYIEKIESLAKSFGRRLTFTAIGIGDLDDYSVNMLKSMVNAAREFSTLAKFELPLMTSLSLGKSFSNAAMTLKRIQTELMDWSTMRQRKVHHVMHESKSKANEVFSEVNNKDYTVYAIDHVRRKIYTENIDAEDTKQVKYKRVPLQHPNTEYVAISKKPFGEGAERFVYRFYELSVDYRTILGQPMVAKECRMVVDGMNDTDFRKNFVKEIIKRQQKARRVAKLFNNALDSHHRVHENTPHISFLDCSIYELADPINGKMSFLVEDKLDHTKWEKWNSKWRKWKSINDRVEGTIDLGGENGTYGGKVEFTPTQVAQAFCHFSYIKSKEKYLVCALKGVHDEEKNLMQFSDPVIHHVDSKSFDHRCGHSRTDRGRKGIKDFFKTHSCEEQGYLCKLLTEKGKVEQFTVICD